MEDLAKACGKSPASVSRWGSGASTPCAESLIRIADLYGCTIDYLVRVPPTSGLHLIERNLVRRQLRAENIKDRVWTAGKPSWPLSDEIDVVAGEDRDRVLDQIRDHIREIGGDVQN